MSKLHNPIRYIVRIQGHLSSKWLSEFEDMTITLTEEGETELKGAIADQSALHALLRKIRDIGVELISVNRIDYDPCDQQRL